MAVKDSKTDDLSQLDRLDVDNILSAIETRYSKDQIYTNVGNILIAVNPCKPLPIYDKKNHEFYDHKSFHDSTPPHIFHVGARVYRAMQETKTNQVVLVCGESGAGKTETTKYLVKHLMEMCPSETGDLHKRIIEINPLLEAFGNAKTIMNDNSSRFAKYLELSFRSDGQVVGATVRDYMLEKSRVVGQSQNEGNFHIFYSLFAGAPKSKLAELGLQKPETYRVMKANVDLLRSTEHYKNMYTQQMAVLREIGLTEEEISVVHFLLASVLHLTQIEFAETDRSTEELDVRDQEPLRLAADCLGLDIETLGHALIATTKEVNGESIKQFKSMDEARDGRDALAKAVYERTFGFIVRKINQNLHPNRSRTITSAVIGLLDIAGFEKLQKNSFEQMCINVTNERLQHNMNEEVIINEKRLYQEEGIPLEEISFQNNKDVLNLYNLPRTGIFAALDEVSKLQQGTDKLFVDRVLQISKDEPKYKNYLTFPKGDRAEFCVKHFAGQVWYNCEGFLEKNRDTLTADINTCLKGSKDPFIEDLFAVKKGPTGTISQTVFNLRKSQRTAGKGGVLKTQAGAMLAAELGKTLTQRYGKIGRPTEIIYLPRDHKSVISYFQKSMNELITKMQLAESHFIRCIKPNMALRPGNFDKVMVRDQLLYNGVAEIAKIRKMAFAVRKKKEDFTKRYTVLFPPGQRHDKLDNILRNLLPPSLAQGFRVGKHKIFMKEEVNTWLEKYLFVRENAASKTIIKGLRVIADKKRREKEKREKERKEREERERREQERKDREEQELRQQEERRRKRQQQEEIPLQDVNGFSNTLGRTDTSNSSQESEGNSTSSSDNFNINKLRGTRGPKGSFRASTGSRATELDSDEEEEEDEDNDHESHGQGPGGVRLQFERPPTPPPPRKTEPEKRKTPFWDIFQIIARENPEQDVHTHLSLRIIKVVTYGLLFLILLASMVTQKISLMSLVVHIRNDSKILSDEAKYDISAHYFLVIVAMCIPYVLIFLVSLWRSLFGNLTFPSVASIIVVCFMEMLHSIGLCLLTLRVLPNLNHAQGIMIMSATCLLPSVLKPLCSKDTTQGRGCGTTCCKILVFVLDLVAIFIQISAIPVAVLSEKNTEFFRKNSDGLDLNIVEIIFALVLCSFSWWENFIDDRLCGGASRQNKIQRAMMGLKFDLQESRSYIFMFAGLIKVITTVITAGLLQIGISYIDLLDFSGIFGQLNGGFGEKKNLSITLLTISSFVAYYTSYTVCKLKMQGVSFALPLLLSTPIAVLIVTVDCEGVISEFHDFYDISSCDQNIFEPWHHVPIGVAWLVSVYWIGRYIWTSSQERLAKVERLFMNPLYCGILLEQHLVMNRRRHNRRITKTTDDKFKLSKDDIKSGNTEDDEQRSRTIPPMIYACATMWHENRQEMVQILKSLYRMDKDQFIRRQAFDMSKNMKDTEYYEFEVHILFDDAFELDDEEEHVPNSFVRMFCSLQNEAASSVHGKPMDITPPFRIPSPYGGQLVFVMPGGNFMFVHLKDKSKIRHRKRWSQVMYMYYLLGYRIVKECQERVLYAMENNAFDTLASWSQHENTGHVERSRIFKLLDDEVIYRAENTFLLALDGDVDFTPGAVRLLLDRMYKNLKVGAACGRIHPIGKGPMVWYQKFEYATAHWLQKATEHVLGCVLCSPGCFSLFRGSALMDDNIMRKYTIMPTEASHHLMYDQGEDRWLCTLLLQQGYRVDYAAASDAFTYAPEAFDEFFNQRRRWMPSTIANIMDLLQDGKNTVSVNNNISWLYIFYQAALMVSCIIGPSTVLMMIAGALLTVFNLDLLVSYLISLAPALFFFTICFLVKSKTQILIAEVLSAIYTFIMMVVLVGAIITAVQESPMHPSVIFLAGLVLIFFIAALFHPREWSCIIYGVLYFLWVPSGFLLLVLYSLCNLHVVSWGTREVPRKKTKKELEEEEKKKKEEAEKKKQGWFARTFGSAKLTSDLKDLLKELPGQKKEEDKIATLLQQLNKNIQLLAKRESGEDVADLEEIKVEAKEKPKKSVHFRETIDEKEIREDEDEYIYQREKKKRDPLKDPAWTECQELGDGENIAMNQEECTFWKGFIDRYLFPLDAEKFKEKNKESAAKLLELRNNICAGMALINLLWLAINFMFQLRKPTVVTFPLPSGKEEGEVSENSIKVDIMGLAFVIFFLVILLIQFTGMIVHRWGTFLHLIAITEIPNPFRRKLADFQSERDKSKHDAKEAVEVCSKLMAEPMPDYSDDEEDEIAQQNRENIKHELENLATVGTRDNLRDSRGLAKSLRVSIGNRKSVSERPYSENISQEETRHHTMADNDFRRTVTDYLRQSRNHQSNPFSVENPNLRQRNRQSQNIEGATAVNIGETLPRDVASAERKFGSGVPYRRDFQERIFERRTDLADRYRFKRPGGRGLGDTMDGGATRLGQSYNRDTFNDRIDEEGDGDEDNIYDEIPAARMGTLGRHFARQLHRMERSGQRRQNGTVGRTRNRNSGINQYMN